jgi:menaquinol-cytochrome c reductase iron-sulfur subunit
LREIDGSVDKGVKCNYPLLNMTYSEKPQDVQGMEPGTSEGKPGRRRFLKIAVGFLASVNGILLGLPFLKTLLTPPKASKSQFTKVKDLGGLPVGEPVDIRFEALVQDAFYRKRVLHMAWVIKRGDGSVTVFSPVCTHLGCYYKWNPEAGEFECPCHASTFAKDGTVLGGPAPRPLDTLPHKVEDNTLYVQWVNYRPGTPKKEAI